MPVLFETERIQMEEAQKNHSKQVNIFLVLFIKDVLLKFHSQFNKCDVYNEN